MSAIRVVLVCALFALLSLVAVEAQLTRPLIDGVLSSPYKRDALSNVAEIIKAEPAIAKLDATSDEDEWNGEEDGEDRFALEKKLKDELRGLVQLVKQSKAILRVLPEKEKRIIFVKAKLDALHNEYAKEDAVLKYQQQRSLMRQIARQESALKERVDKLKTTEAKLAGNIAKHQEVLKAVGVSDKEIAA